jgi:hypothetical protein
MSVRIPSETSFITDLKGSAKVSVVRMEKCRKCLLAERKQVNYDFKKISK